MHSTRGSSGAEREMLRCRLQQSLLCWGGAAQWKWVERRATHPCVCYVCVIITVIAPKRGWDVIITTAAITLIIKLKGGRLIYKSGPRRHQTSSINETGLVSWSIFSPQKYVMNTCIEIWVCFYQHRLCVKYISKFQTKKEFLNYLKFGLNYQSTQIFNCPSPHWSNIAF